MTNTTSAAKAFKVSVKNAERNKSRKSRVKTFLKKVLTFIVAKDENASREAFRVFESEIMKGVTKGAFKLNTAARILRRLAQKIRNLKEVKNS